MIIGLAGQKQSGKDTTAAYLMKEHGFERRAFADPLKRSVAALFLDIPYHKIDQWKNDDRVTITLNVPQGDGTPGVGMTFRAFLQRYGTESHRGVFDNDFWLQYTLPADGYYAGKKIVITDCRFENEVSRVRQVGGYVVNVTRPNLGLELQDLHSSESGLPDSSIDYSIFNDGSLTMLYEATERMLYELGERKYEYGTQG